MGAARPAAGGHHHPPRVCPVAPPTHGGCLGCYPLADPSEGVDQRAEGGPSAVAASQKVPRRLMGMRLEGWHLAEARQMEDVDLAGR